MGTNTFLFENIILKKKGFLRGPFGGDLKKEIFVEKGPDTYKVYEQGVVLNSDKNIGRYYVSKKHYDEKLYKFSVQDKDFLVSCSGVNMGAIYQLKYPFEKGIINQALLRIRLNEDIIDDNYFYYLFKELIVKKIITGSGDSTIPNFPSLEIIKQIEVELPSKEIQKKIGAVLSALDAKIDLNNRINAELEAMAKTLYDYWFVQFDFPNAEGKPYKTSGGKMVWNEELKREIPEGWTVKKLGDIVSLEYGKPLKEEDRVGNSYPVYGSNGIVGYNNEYLVEGPGIIIGRKGTAGAVVWAEDDFYPIDTTFYVKDNLNIDQLYFHYFLLLRSDLQKSESSSAVPGLNRNLVYSINTPVPETRIIRKFNELAAPLFNKSKVCNKENQQLSALRDWLLPMLMNGQVTVGNVSQSVAEKPAIAQAETLFIADNKKAFARQVLGGKIVSLFQNDPHFSSIKFQKIQYLAEHLAEADLNGNYYYQAAGPYDNVFMHTITDKLKASHWFEKQGNRYVPLSKQEQIDGYYQGFFKPVAPRLDQLFSLMANLTDIEAEIIATLYAVWNNRIILHQPIAEELLIEDFYNWSDRKLLYPQVQVQQGLQWMHTHGIIPTGFGKELRKAKEKVKRS